MTSISDKYINQISCLHLLDENVTKSRVVANCKEHITDLELLFLLKLYTVLNYYSDWFGAFSKPYTSTVLSRKCMNIDAEYYIYILPPYRKLLMVA